MAEMRQRNYGEATTIQFSLIEPGGASFATGIVGATGDSMWVLDGTGYIETNNTFSEVSTNSGVYKIDIDAVEMRYTGAASLVFVDLTSPKAFLDKEIVLDNIHANTGVLSWPQIGELTGDIGANPTIEDALMLLYMALRNKGTSSTGVGTDTGYYTIANDSDIVVLSGATVETGFFRREKLSS